MGIQIKRCYWSNAMASYRRANSGHLCTFLTSFFHSSKTVDTSVEFELRPWEEKVSMMTTGPLPRQLPTGISQFWPNLWAKVEQKNLGRFKTKKIILSQVKLLAEYLVRNKFFRQFDKYDFLRKQRKIFLEEEKIHIFWQTGDVQNKIK